MSVELVRAFDSGTIENLSLNRVAEMPLVRNTPAAHGGLLVHRSDEFIVVLCKRESACQ